MGEIFAGELLGIGVRARARAGGLAFAGFVVFTMFVSTACDVMFACEYS